MDQEMIVNGSEIYSNVTLQELGNQSAPAKEAPIAVITFTMSVIAWIILSNSLLIISLLVSGQNMKNVSNIQILTLAVTDATVGVSAIPAALTFHIMGSFPYYGTCATIMALYLTARTASLFHMLEICIYRAMVSLRRSVMTHERRSFKLALLVMLPWAAAICLNATIFLIYGARNRQIRSCSAGIALHGNYLRATRIFFGVWVGTASLIIITYVFMSLHLLVSSRRMNARRIHAVQVPEGSHPYMVSSQSITTAMNSSGKAGVGMSVITDHSSTASTSVSPGNCASLAALTHSSSCQQDAESRPIYTRTMPAGFSDKQIAGRHPPNNPARTHAVGPNARWQKQVIVTIGILLTVLIVCLTPYASLLAIEFSSDYVIPRAVKFVIATLVMCNSAINPFIYAIRMRSLRESIMKNWQRMCRIFTNSRVLPIPRTNN